ncbi:alpha/beta hydrolase [Cytobacillus oceanisediminis]|uniref:alpha/beta hydrolase n=1 Tax=Cytobacillus oceanisediminis TaxID=665099 RepID=UPI0023DCD467|nr:alpha/beta hydrolase [Cytobacillus oceanisediminis]MDF2036475.1 alpha/beta hydrolase [Cytobacillus oceanisediminis]
MVGYLYQVKNDNQLPCIIMGSGFGGTQDTPSMIAKAKSFAQAGFAAFTFDYRNLGESEGRPRQLVSIAGQQEDFLSAISFIKGQPSVDGKRLALWGSSLGGGHVVSVAAISSDISTVISQIPFNGFPKNNGRSLKGTVSLLRAMYKDLKRGKKGEPPFYIPVVGQVGELAVMTSEEASKTIAGMQSKTWRNEVAPRALIEMMKYRPCNSGGQVKAKVLICYGEYDKETQGPQTMEMIKSIPNVEVKSYPVPHFEFYNPEVREGVIADQIAFLKKCFPA